MTILGAEICWEPRLNDNVHIMLTDMDVGIGEQIIEKADGSYGILLNARASREQNLEDYNHAIDHLLERHFQEKSVQQIEMKAHHLPVATVAPVVEPEKPKVKVRPKTAINKAYKAILKKMSLMDEYAALCGYEVERMIIDDENGYPVCRRVIRDGNGRIIVGVSKRKL